MFESGERLTRLLRIARAMLPDEVEKQWQRTRRMRCFARLLQCVMTRC